MPVFEIEGSIHIDNISSPGTRLKCRNALFIEVLLFGKYRSRLSYDPVFPMLFEEKFQFREILGSFPDVRAAKKALDDIGFSLELRQESVYYPKGDLLAYFDTSVSEMFCLSSRQYANRKYRHTRELLMIRAYSFQGISPKVSYSSTCTLSCDKPHHPVTKQSELAPQYRKETRKPKLKETHKRIDKNEIAAKHVQINLQEQSKRNTQSERLSRAAKRRRYIRQRYCFSISPCNKYHSRIPLEFRDCMYVPKPKHAQKNHLKDEVSRINQNLSRARDHVEKLLALTN